MDEVRIAGHMWTNDRIDSCCELILSNGETCYMTRASLFTVTRDDLNKPGIAHSGSLTGDECTQIEEAKAAYDAHCEKVMSALRQVCG